MQLRLWHCAYASQFKQRARQRNSMDRGWRSGRCKTREVRATVSWTTHWSLLSLIPTARTHRCGRAPGAAPTRVSSDSLDQNVRDKDGQGCQNEELLHHVAPTKSKSKCVKEIVSLILETSKTEMDPFAPQHAAFSVVDAAIGRLSALQCECHVPRSLSKTPMQLHPTSTPFKRCCC